MEAESRSYQVEVCEGPGQPGQGSRQASVHLGGRPWGRKACCQDGRAGAWGQRGVPGVAPRGTGGGRARSQVQTEGIREEAQHSRGLI